MQKKEIEPARNNGREREELTMTEAEYFRAIGRLEGQVSALAQSVSEVKTKVDAVDTRLSNLDRMANQWKGGFAVILSLGAVAGVVIDQVVRLLFSR